MGRTAASMRCSAAAVPRLGLGLGIGIGLGLEIGLGLGLGLGCNRRAREGAGVKEAVAGRLGARRGAW